MKKICSSAFLLCLVYALSAQSLSPQVIASTGGFSSNGNGSLSYTVGEMTMVQTFSANGNILTQGFQQPNDTGTILGLVNISQGEFGSFVVYPNPAVDLTMFAFAFSEQGRISVSLYNALGQKISDVYQANYNTGNNVVQLNTSLLASGMYFLTLNFTGTGNNEEHTISRKLQVIR